FTLYKMHSPTQENQTATHINISAVADPNVWGHAFYGEAMACAASAAACTGHKQPLVRGIPDQVCSWPVPAAMAGTNTRHVGRHANRPTCHVNKQV
ncbi:unnamed protein product, partial [Adineta steineri]